MYLHGKGRKRLIRVTVVVAVAALVLSVAASLLTALAADAHTALKSVSPADRSTATTAPTEVRLEFTEAVSASFATVTVTGVDGAAATEGKPSVAGPVVTQPLTDGLGSGAYAVTYRVVSADGHPITGKTTFTLDVGPALQGGGTTATPGDTGTRGPAPTANGEGSSATSGGVTVTASPAPTATSTATPTLVETSGSSLPDGSTPVLLAGGALVLAALVLALLLARRRRAETSDADHT